MAAISHARLCLLERGKGGVGEKAKLCPSVLRRVCQDVRDARLKPFANYLNISNARGFTSVFFPLDFPSLNFPLFSVFRGFSPVNGSFIKSSYFPVDRLGFILFVVVLSRLVYRFSSCLSPFFY